MDIWLQNKSLIWQHFFSDDLMNTVRASKQPETEIVYQKSTEKSQTHSWSAVFKPEETAGQGGGRWEKAL